VRKGGKSLVVGIHTTHETTALPITTVLVAVFTQSNVSFFSPSLAPRVLHFPVVLSSLGSESNHKNTVVQAGSAISSENTGAVELESSLVSFNSN